MQPMAPPTASAGASWGGHHCSTNRAQSADTVLPTTQDQGWASGLVGTANSSTAVAPSGANRRRGRSQVPACASQTRAVAIPMPTMEPMATRHMSAGAGRGTTGPHAFLFQPMALLSFCLCLRGPGEGCKSASF